jgi:DNA-binding transcriptional LysR family regulator
VDTIANYSVFVQVAESRSFVATSRALGVSASAIGKTIGRLEARLGVRLFHRSTRSVTLTQEGVQFLDRCRRILSEVEAAETEFSKTVSAPRGRLRVSLPVVGEPFLPVLAGFRKAYPEVELDLNFEDRRVDVIEEGYDAVIRAGDVPDSRLTSRLLGEHRMILVGAPEYFSHQGEPARPADLLRHACIQFRFPNTGKLQPWPVFDDADGRELQLPTSVVCNSFEARIALALAGVGIAFLPEFAIAGLLAQGRLVQVLKNHSQRGTYRIMWPSGRHAVPRLRAFVDYLGERLVLG